MSVAPGEEEAPTRAEVMRLERRVGALEEQLKEWKDGLTAMQVIVAHNTYLPSSDWRGWGLG